MRSSWKTIMDFMEVVRRSRVEGVSLQAAREGDIIVGGTLVVTAYFFIYSTRKIAGEDELIILHVAIDHVERVKAPALTAVVCLKDFRRLQFEFQTPEDCVDMMDALEALSKPVRIHHLHAFTHFPRVTLPPMLWPFSTAEALLAAWGCSQERYRVSYINSGFKVCASYPQDIIVPLSITDDEIKKSASYRHQGRFPMVCFHHKKSGAVLIKCGQPLVGPTSKRCREDVSILNACLPGLSKGKVMDIRSQSIAQQHMSKGGGTEIPSHYPQWRVEYAKLDSPLLLQASLTKLLDACGDPSLSHSSSWFGRLESSGWLEHVSKLMSAAKAVSLAIHNDGSSVVVHGAGSRDASLQVTSLAQILLDPHCRTVHGFIELVKREWLDSGHPFSLRHNHVKSAPEKEKAPIFLQFLDSVWQVMQQFPLSFEFNEGLLHNLFVHSYSSVYGTFLYDSPMERRKNKLDDKTQSLWRYLSQPHVYSPLLNPLYDLNPSVLLLSVSPLTVTLWRRLYLNTSIEAQLTPPTLNALKELKDTNTALREKLSTVRKELMDLQIKGRKFASNWS
ncbi:myotubularin-related protein 9-like [Halichondria panicea]|uniref:myotubularin-related protein 9-like n=1 Tax=Halichondria panicea TaxID=6063 RepID=UPI00312B5677